MEKIEGIITALITPFTPDGELKEEALHELVEFQVKSGVNGLYPCGTAGQGPIMSPNQRKRAVEIVIEQVKGRIPVIVHIGAVNTETAIDLAKHAEKTGAKALGCVTPYYYRPGDEALLEHYKRIAEATGLPLFVYNLPRYTGINVGSDLLLRLSEVPNIVGVKDSSRDYVQILEYLERLPGDFTVICGTDAYILPALIMGAKGSISAYSNPFPEIYVELYTLYREGRYEEAVKLQLRLNAIRRALGKPPIAPLHEALRMRGIDAGTVKWPLRPLTEKERKDLRAELVELKALEQ